MAEEQTVLGVLFRGIEIIAHSDIEDINIPKDIWYQWFAINEQIKAHNDFVNRELCTLASFLSKMSIDYRIVKGQIVATCYPVPNLRQSGDIDIWIGNDVFVQCEQLIEKELNVFVLHNGSEKHVELQINGVLYELHNRLATIAIKKHQWYLDKLVEQDEVMVVKVGEIEIPTLSPTVNALYIFIHLFFHLVHNGVGLRQLCDWMMWLHKYKDEIDREALRRHLDQMRLYRPYCVLGTILVYNLGLPKEEFPFEIKSKDKNRSRKVLQDIMESGNFGHKKEKIRKLGLMHSLQTGYRMIVQSLKYIDLAPYEIICRIPHNIMWYFRK